jgi:hypothetical protein
MPKFSADVGELLFRMNKLVEAAEVNRNPIAFFVEELAPIFSGNS